MAFIAFVAFIAFIAFIAGAMMIPRVCAGGQHKALACDAGSGRKQHLNPTANYWAKLIPHVGGAELVLFRNILSHCCLLDL
jgi:hypothetical protein